MTEAMVEAVRTGDVYRRVEVITGRRRRLDWTAQDKARIVAESCSPGANISQVARRNGVNRGLLGVWRRQVHVPAMPETVPFFAAVQIEDGPPIDFASSPAPRKAVRPQPGVMIGNSPVPRFGYQMASIRQRLVS